jgi:hypothetical protein
MRSERFQAMVDGLSLAAKSLAAIARTNRALAEEVFSEELPWLAWLPAEGRVECVRELLDHLRAGAETGLLLPFARASRGWKSTAEVYSDPELARRLRGTAEPVGSGMRSTTSARSFGLLRRAPLTRGKPTSGGVERSGRA